MKIPEVNNSEELICFASLIEESGYRMYRALAEKSPQEELKSLFLSLADEEMKHKEMFLSLKGGGTSAAEPSVSGEEDEAGLFDPERLLTEIGHIETAEDLLNFAIRRELDTILFYKRMAHTGYGDPSLLESLIKMEETHFYRLHEVKENL